MSRQPTDARDLTGRSLTAAGTKVYDADGTHVGMVSNPTHRDGHLVVELGLMSMHLAFLPQDAIAQVDDRGVRLNVTRDDLSSGRYSSPPAGTGRVADSSTVLPNDEPARGRASQPSAPYDPATTPPPSLTGEDELGAPRGRA